MNIRNGTDLAAWTLCLAVIAAAAAALWLGWKVVAWTVNTLLSWVIG